MGGSSERHAVGTETKKVVCGADLKLHAELVACIVVHEPAAARPSVAGVYVWHEWHVQVSVCV